MMHVSGNAMANPKLSKMNMVSNQVVGGIMLDRIPRKIPNTNDTVATDSFYLYKRRCLQNRREKSQNSHVAR